MGESGGTDVGDAPVVLAYSGRGSLACWKDWAYGAERRGSISFLGAQTSRSTVLRAGFRRVLYSISDQKEVAPFGVPYVSSCGWYRRGYRSRQKVRGAHPRQLGLACMALRSVGVGAAGGSPRRLEGTPFCKRNCATD